MLAIDAYCHAEETVQQVPLLTHRVT